MLRKCSPDTELGVITESDDTLSRTVVTDGEGFSEGFQKILLRLIISPQTSRRVQYETHVDYVVALELLGCTEKRDGS